MAIRKRCRRSGCKYGNAGCGHPWWFDTMIGGRRYRMPVDDFAVPRMKQGEARPVTTKQEAEKRWYPLFIGEIMAGRDPRIPPKPSAPVSGVMNVSEFLDLFHDEYVKPQRLASAASVRSRMKVLKTHLGGLPVPALEHAEAVNRFRTSEYADDVEPASVNRVLEVLRTAINWGIHAKAPPLLVRSPFHKFGVTLDKKAERSRDRRLKPGEEARLLFTALNRMNGPEHKHAGSMLHDRIIGALELCCRRGEMLMIQNCRVDWESHQVFIPGATAKDKENRRIPFDPDGRLAPILKRRAQLGPAAYVFGQANGRHQANIQTAWESLRLLANGLDPRTGPGRSGTANSSRPSTYIGTTYGTKAPVGYWLMAWIFGRFS